MAQHWVQDYPCDYSVPGLMQDYPCDYSVPGLMQGYPCDYSVPGLMQGYPCDYSVPGLMQGFDRAKTPAPIRRRKDDARRAEVQYSTLECAVSFMPVHA